MQVSKIRLVLSAVASLMLLYCVVYATSNWKTKTPDFASRNQDGRTVEEVIGKWDGKVVGTVDVPKSKDKQVISKIGGDVVRSLLKHVPEKTWDGKVIGTADVPKSKDKQVISETGGDVVRRVLKHVPEKTDEDDVTESEVVAEEASEHAPVWSVFRHCGEESAREPKLYPDVPFSTLLADFLQYIQDLKTYRFWIPSTEKTITCDKVKTARPCIDTRCKARVPGEPKQSLRSTLRTMEGLDHLTLKEVTRLLKPRYSKKSVIFVTAVSSNHFNESQALIRNLHENVFPHLDNYTFVLYDLGLTLMERSEMERFCRCEVRTFPLSSMPPALQNLKCYTWKPLIINANLPTADKLVWVDASIRFNNRSIQIVLQELEKKRMNINWDPYSIAFFTTAAMFDYFGEQTCSFAHVAEIAANFLSFKNDRFIRNAVIKPWVACALTANCMCPPRPETLLKCHMWQKYNHCHRFDQSALGIILVKLFRGHEQSVKVSPKRLKVKRYHEEQYFDKLAKDSEVKLFKNFKYKTNS